MAISLLTVTFARDFELLKRQLKSFDLFLDQKYPHVIILNDDSEWPGSVHKSQVPGFRQSQWGGWIDQQTLKLLAANVITTDYYMVFDSKNYLHDTFSPNKLPNVAVHENTGKWEGQFNHYLKCSYEVFGLNCKDYSNEIMCANTPFVMNTQVVKDMIEYLETNNIDLIDLLGQGKEFQCVEFYLYSAWCSKNNIKMSWRESFYGVAY